MSLPPDIRETLAGLKEAQDRIESTLKTKGQHDKQERIIKWLTLLATICSTIILGILTWVAQDFQRTIAALGEIRDLSSDNRDVRFGAEKFLARGEYSGLVLRAAVINNDVESLQSLASDEKINKAMQEKYRSASATLLEEYHADQKCLNGSWIEPGKFQWTLRVQSPGQLLLSRDGFSFQVYKSEDKIHWRGTASYATNPPRLIEVEIQNQCTSIQSTWGWALVRLSAQQTSPSASTPPTPPSSDSNYGLPQIPKP